MSKLIGMLAGTAVALSAAPAIAQEKGDSFVRIAAARTKLVDKGDVKTNGVLDPLADYETREAYHGVLTVGYFPIPSLAIEASISTPLTTNNIPAGSLAGVPNLGDDEFVLATLGASVHPFRGRISPYVGGGIQVQLTTQERDGLGVNLNIPNAHGPYVHAGVDFKVDERWGVFFDVRKAFYHTNATGLLPLDATFTSFAAIDAKAELDPLTIQLGAVARFGRAAKAAGPADFSATGNRWAVRAGLSALELADRAQMVVGGTALSGEGISTFEHHTPSIQIGRFLTRNVAVNATLGLPPKIDIFGAGSIGGLPKLGRISYGPTALTLQYHFRRSGRIRPYVGAGASYLIVFDTTDGAFQDLKVKNDLGPAFEAGTDFMIARDFGLFVDVKKAFLRPKASGTFEGASVEVATKLDPWVFSGGFLFSF